MEKNIQGVIDNGLCSACGSCAGICPVNAIQMEANPAGFLYASINKEKCIGCAKCLRICPSFYENIPYIVPEDWSDGKYLTGYVGYAVSEEIREESQSGGLVSALLTYMLKNGTIDGAVVSDFDISLQKPIPKYVSSEEDIVHAAGSYYSQVPMLNMLWNHQDEKVAVVALGCQSESIHLAVDRLKMKRPEMILGLVCGWQFSMEMTNDLIRLGGGKRRKLKTFLAKEKKKEGWPGGVFFVDTDNNEYRLPGTKRTSLRHYYWNYRCIQCFDYNNVYADITFGDPWFLLDKWGHEKLKKGYTVALVRTERGQELMDSAIKAGVIVVEKIDPQVFLEYNDKSYCYPKTIYTQIVLNDLKLPSLYKNINLEKRTKHHEANNKEKKEMKYYNEINAYSYKYYFADSKERAQKMVKKEKLKITVRQIPTISINFLKRVVKYIYRNVMR